MKTTAIILAAGLGKRMKKNYPKVLAKLADKELILHVLDSVKQLDLTEVIIVIGYKGEDVISVVKPIYPRYKFANQPEQLGTGHAVLCARDNIPNNSTDILVLCGDTPMITAETLNSLISKHRDSKAEATVLTAEFDNPTGYGRIIRDNTDHVIGIVEEADADDQIKRIKEINSGIYLFKRDALLSNLDKLKNNNRQGEYYLTDIIRILFTNHCKIAGMIAQDPNEIRGINTVEHLNYLEEILREKR